MKKITNKYRRGPIGLWPLIACSLTVGCGQSFELPDDGFVDVPGGRIAFRVLGEGSDIPVLVIHGGPGASSCSFVSGFSGVASERPVIIYDQLGSGYSDRISDLETYATLSRFAEEISAIREELRLDELHIVGHSWGAAVALEYLLTLRSDGVRSVTFAGPLLGTDRWLEDAKQLLAELPADVQDAVQDAEESGDFTTPEFEAANRHFIEQYLRRTPREFLDTAACDARPRGDSGLYEYMWGPAEFIATGTLRSYDRIDRLPELDLPVLFLVGQYDEARPETVRDFQSMVPGSRVTVIPDAAHLAYLDQTRAFNTTLIEFFSNVESD